MAKLINADKLIQRLRSKQPIGDIGKATIEECIAEINYAKPVKPERPKGHWESGILGFYRCSNCRSLWEASIPENVSTNFCLSVEQI